MPEPTTAAGRAFVTGEATRQLFHVIDGRRDNLIVRVLAIEAEAIAAERQRIRAAVEGLPQPPDHQMWDGWQLRAAILRLVRGES